MVKCTWSPGVRHIFTLCGLCLCLAPHCKPLLCTTSQLHLWQTCQRHVCGLEICVCNHKTKQKLYMVNPSVYWHCYRHHILAPLARGQTNATEMAITETWRAPLLVTVALQQSVLDGEALTNLLAPNRSAVLFLTVLLYSTTGLDKQRWSEPRCHRAVSCSTLSVSEKAAFSKDRTQAPVGFQCGKEGRSSSRVFRLMWKQRG